MAGQRRVSMCARYVAGRSSLVELLIRISFFRKSSERFRRFLRCVMREGRGQVLGGPEGRGGVLGGPGRGPPGF